MADTLSKKDKIAAAKKKLKQYKKTGGSSNLVDGNATPPSARGQSPSVGIVENSHPTDLQQMLLPSIIRSSPDVTNNYINRPLTTSTERLHQLSRQVTGLISESSNYLNGQGETNNEFDILEKRNSELAMLLEQHSQLNSHLTIQLDELKNQNGRLQQTSESEKRSNEERIKREIGALKEQLQVHIQTIGILVAEKTELQSSLNQSQKSVEANHAEFEELSGRLKASRQRVTDLERNFSSANNSNQKNEKSNKELSKDLEKLKLDLYKTNKSNEEFQQHNRELQGKLQQKASELARSEDELIETKGRLEMTELFVQQLQGGGAGSVDFQQVDKLVTEKMELQTRLHQFEEALAKQNAERDALTLQYSQYIEQLQQQLRYHQEQVSGLAEERDKSLRRCRELDNTIDELKTNNAAANEVHLERSEMETYLSENIEKLTAHLSAVSKNLEVQVADNSQLSRLIIEKEECIVELELEMERLGASTADSGKLLETMQNDKTALSRAVAQNKELKNQLAELQNGFVKMSTENMDVLTQMQTEQHISKELAARLGHQEEELKEIREQLIEKEHQLIDLQRRDAERAASHRTELSSEEMEERIQDFQQQIPLVETLQRELSSAQDTINGLTNQNSDLRSQLIKIQSNGLDRNRDSDVNSSHVDSLSASIRQLEMERDQALDRFDESQRIQKALEEKLNNIQHDLAVQVPATFNGDVITKVHFEALQHAMTMLEGKYTRMMREKADLADKTDQLEHLVMQLQGESETIGEYVTLYQQQRSVLRQRTAEKDTYIYQLAHERVEMQSKLGELQALVMQLLGERRMLHGYHDKDRTTTIFDATTSSSTYTTPVAEATQRKKRRHDRQPAADAGGSQEGEWPDYSSSASESEVDRIEGQTPGETNQETTTPMNDGESQALQTSSAPPGPADAAASFSAPQLIPSEGMTAQKIMHLLNEIGTSHLVDRWSYDERYFLQCNRCSGHLITL